MGREDTGLHGGCSMNYYNENDPKAAAWLRELIAAGHIANGIVDERSITDITARDLEGYTQCHFFAGIGGWSLALRLAGWPDSRPVWTGSCPCQPFSVAGKGLGEKDERHLWPVLRELIRECSPSVVFGALIGAMFWNVVTWWRGIPSSSSHALVGGLVGAGVAHAGLSGIQWAGLNKTVIAIFLSPMLGMLLSMLIMLASSWIFNNATPRGAEGSFKFLHIASSATYSISHGLNDAQKTMGIITVLLYSTGYLQGDFHVPHWVAISCYVAISLGTLSGGWKIIQTMGTRITKLSQHQGFSASLGGSVMVFTASALGIPVSTTHTITGCIIGAGTARRTSSVRWGVAGNVVVAWIITIPASALVGALDRKSVV